ncbi:MAG: VIT domain-containing protein [Planctomycetota bacterium]|jgi:Ca-activated chloride channel family protein
MTRTAKSHRAFNTLVAALAAAFASGTSAWADGIIMPRPWPGPRPEAQIPPAIKYHKVKVDVRGRIATTTVDQVFINPNRRPMEGEYIFPIPERASVSRFTLDIDGETVEAELLDAKKARQIYEDIVRRQKDPALLEYAGRGLFKARVFPIPAGGTRRITLRYEEEVARNGSLFAYRYPLNTEKFSSRPIEEVAVEVNLGGVRPIRSVVCPSHSGDAEVRRERGGTATVSLKQRNVRPDRDFIVYYGLGGELAVDVVAHRKSGGRDAEAGYFMLAISPPQGDERSVRERPKDICFVVDTSGSMAGEKLDQAKGALRYCLNSLAPADRFGIVRFSTEAEAFRGGLVPASRQNVRDALAFVDRFKARGGTAIEEALSLALRSMDSADRGRGRPAMVAFLTDGQPTIGERNADAIVKKVKDANRSKARVFVFGVGNDLNARLLDRLSEECRGSRTYVAPEENIEVAVSGFFDRIASPVLTDLRLDFGRSLQVTDVYPRELGDLFRGDDLVVYGRYRGTFGSHAITLRGKTERGERSYVFETGFPGEEPANALVARLWAIRKIGYLLDDIRLNGETAEVKAEVVRLAREFGIMTPYTSMLVLEDEARPTPPGGPRRGHGILPEAAAEAPARPSVDMKKMRDAMGGAADAAAESGRFAVGASRAAGRLRKGEVGEKEMLEGLAERAREQVKHLEDKTFYLRGGIWWDSTVDTDAERVKVKYLSAEYFALSRTSPEVGKYLALGERVVFVLDGKTYEIVP